MRAPVINPDDVHRYIEKVKNGIEHCIKEYMNEEQTIDYLCRVAKIPPHITSMMWKCLQESNPEFFNEYFMRLQLVRQIKTFNGLLNKQVQILQLVKNPPPPPFYNPNIHNWQPWSSPFDKPFPRSNDGQRMMFPGTVCNSGIASSYDFKVSVAPNIGIVPPQDNSPPFPFYPANGSSYTGSNINALPNFMVPVPNSYPSLGPSNNGRFMRQNSPPALSSSTFPVNGNMPQLPTMHDSSLFPASSYQVGDSCMSLLQEHTSSNSDIDSPMNTEDENDSVTQPVTGGPTVDDGTGSSPSV